MSSKKDFPSLNPPVNVVVTYHPEVIMAFQQAESFTAFIAAKKKLDAENKKAGLKSYTYIFNNAPNSTFLSLSHAFGIGGGVNLQIEIIDPQGLFEEGMLDNSIESWLPAESDPVTKRLLELVEERRSLLAQQQDLKHQKEVIENSFRKKKDWTQYNSKSAWIKNKESYILTQIKHLKGIQADHYKTLKDAIDKDKQVTQMQRPVYITYGIGEDLRDWSPPQCYGPVRKLEYSFTGQGARVLKLFYIGLGAHPNLLQGTQGSLSVLGKPFTAGLLTQGTSEAIFNKFMAERNKEFYKNKNLRDTPSYLAGDVFSNYMRPSLHLAVTQAITDFIKRGSNEENVYVLLPNLDKALKGFLASAVKLAKQTLSNITTSKYKGVTFLNLDDIAYFEGFRIALEQLGLTLCESSVDFQPIGKIVYKDLEKVLGESNDAFNNASGPLVPFPLCGTGGKMILYGIGLILDNLKRLLSVTINIPLF